MFQIICLFCIFLSYEVKMCPTPYKEYDTGNNRYCFYVSTTKFNWCEAVEFCQKNNGWLAFDVEALWKVRVKLSVESHLPAWIGIHDLLDDRKTKKDNWQTIDGGIISRSDFWSGNDPNNLRGGQDCAMLYNVGGISDFECHRVWRTDFCHLFT